MLRRTDCKHSISKSKVADCIKIPFELPMESPKKEQSKYSDVVGVNWVKSRNSWDVTFQSRGQKTYLGVFANKTDAEYVALKYRMKHPVDRSEIMEKIQRKKTKRFVFKGRQATSLYKGVCWNKHAQRWGAYIKPNKHLMFLGYFINEIDAARAYDIAAIKLFRKDALTNAEMYPEGFTNRNIKVSI